MHDRLIALGIANEIPQTVAAMIMACLAKHPTQRPQSAREVADWIGLEASQKPLSGLDARDLPESVPSPQKISKSVGKGKLLWFIGTPAALVLALGGWYWATHPESNSQSPHRVVADEATANVQTIPASNVSGSIPPPAGLIHWWPGDGDARDVVGKSDGVMQQKGAFASGRVGKAALGHALAAFKNDADMLGTPLVNYAKNAVNEVIAVGRAGTLVDWLARFACRSCSMRFRTR